MHDHIFRKYDIRGIVDKDLLMDDVYTFGRALAAYFLERDPLISSIVVAMDGRVHSQAIKDELIRALHDSGLNTIFCGICPTPVCYFVLHTLVDTSAGVMITASHNGKEYNGFKICFDKDLIAGDEILKIRDYYRQKKEVVSLVHGQVSYINAISAYITWLEKAFAHLKNSTLAAVIDCGNGASAAVIPALVERMQWSRVKVLYGTVDGSFPHRSPDPTKKGVLSGLEQSLRDAASLGIQACGIAYDGDADRVVAMTHHAEVLVGDILLAILSKDLVQSGTSGPIVFDGKCSQVLSSSLKSWNVPFYMTATGSAFVKEKMKETQAALGGELSSHIFFADRYFGYDDGIYATLRLFEVLDKTHNSLHDLWSQFPKSYTTGEVRIPCPEGRKTEVVATVQATFLTRSDVTMSLLDGVRIETEYGWGIVRASNTEPVISFSCESMTEEGFCRIKRDFTTILDTVL